MLILCDEIQNETGKHYASYEVYSEICADKVDWYQTIYSDFASKLKNESQGNQDEKYQVEYEILAKKELLNVIEPLIKLALSRFTYGPTKEFFKNYGFDSFNSKEKNIDFNKSWLDNKTEFAVLVEILAHVLDMNRTEYEFDLKVLANDRDQRNTADHQGTRIRCVTLIRKYESIRNLLAFLDTENNNLPHFQDDSSFDYSRLIEEPCSFSFKETTTVLIVDSVHDIAKGYRNVIANQPWDLVIDFDGYSGFGGLLSSVEHNRIRKELLINDTLKLKSLPNLDRMQTMWCRCGEYLLTDFHRPNRVDILGYKDFLRETKKFQKMITYPLNKVLEKATNLQRFINIVVLSDDGRIVNGTIDALRDITDDYFVSWVGVAESDVEKDFDNNEGSEFCRDHFYHHECPICSFFKAFYEYRGNWEPRISIKIDFALPTSDGSFVSLNENMRNNLSPYFEVLYRNWDLVDPPDDAFIDPFEKGGRATWNDIASEKALHLDNKIEKKVKDNIKTTTGKAQEDSPQKKIFFVKHKAGIGGTTFVKQVAWNLHNDMAVLEVKCYDEKKTISLLQDLYDNIIDKNPILLVAEDTLLNIEAMCDAFLVYMKSRRCALIIACRENNGLCEKYKDSQNVNILQLCDGAINTLKSKFRDISQLSKTELFEKLGNFDSEIKGDMRTPFIIGLYFLEKEFRIESYISKVLDNESLPIQKKMIALLALCDKYNSKELPSSFINRILGFNLRTRNSFIKMCPGVESLICRGINKSGVEVYSFKHRLLSEQYFLMYTQKEDTNLYLLTKELIKLAAKCQEKAEQECVCDTLIDILIRNKDSNIDKLSQLLTDIALTESQRSLIEFLAEQFKPSADKILCEMDTECAEKFCNSDNGLLRLVSHAYAHLGMLYTNYPQNYETATRYLSLAEQYMPYHDKFIFHMYGKVLYRQLCKMWKADLDKLDSNDLISMPDYDEMVDKSFDLFGKTSESGDVQFGITGQLDLLYEYLKFIYGINQIFTKDDLRKLSTKQMAYQTLFIDTLDVAKQYEDFDTDAIGNIRHKENQLRSDVLMGDIGKTVEYYQNEYDKQKNSNNTENILSALNGLVSARIQKAKEEYDTAKSKRLSFYQMLSDPKTLFYQIEELIEGLYNRRGYSAYVKRTALFRHWFQLAKLLNHPVNEGLIKVTYWVDLENEVKGKKNPEPFYYQIALLCLEKIEGGEYENELQEARSIIAKMSSLYQFDPKRGRLDRIKDILVEGTGMGKLLNISDCGTTADIANRINYAERKPITLSGSFETSQYWGIEILIYDPSTLNDLKVLSKIGRMANNTLSEQQIGHKIKCFAGFTALGLRAISDSVKDQSTKEDYNIIDIINKMRKTKGSNSTNAEEKQSQIELKKAASSISKQTYSANHEVYKDNVIIGERKVFHPKYIVYCQNNFNEPLYLNGEVDDGVGSISVKYMVKVFEESNVEAYGGIHNILERLIDEYIEINTTVKSVREKDRKKQYTLCLYDEMIELSQLLQIQSEAVDPLRHEHIEIFEEQTVLPDLNSKEVTFIPDDATLEKTFGKFVIDGTEYAGTLTNVKSPKDKKKAKKFNGRIPAKIQGQPQSGKYSLKMIR